MTSEGIQQEIDELQAQIDEKMASVAELTGTTAEELDLASLSTEGLDEEQTAEVKRLVNEITRLSMRIQALKEMLGDATAGEATSFGG